MSFQHTFSAFTNYASPSQILGGGDNVTMNLGDSQASIEDASDATMIAHEGGHEAEEFKDGEVAMKVADAGQPPMNAVITAVVLRARHVAGGGGDSNLVGAIERSGSHQEQTYSSAGSMTNEDKSFATAPDGSAWTRVKLFETRFALHIGGGLSGDNAHFVAKFEVVVIYESPAGMRAVAIL